MTNKEFEDKKQEIIDDIDNAASKGLIPNGVRKWEITEVALGEIETKIKQLQPPKPPTCATCTTCGAVDNICAWDLVSRNNYNLDKTEFGCIHHSELENND